MSREPRDPRLFLGDILLSANKVMRFTHGLDQVGFESNDLVRDAVLRNLEIIGEATHKLPSTVTQGSPETKWEKIRGFRNYLAHAYFGLDDDVVWDVIRNEIPPLCKVVQSLLNQLDHEIGPLLPESTD